MKDRQVERHADRLDGRETDRHGSRKANRQKQKIVFQDYKFRQAEHKLWTPLFISHTPQNIRVPTNTITFEYYIYFAAIHNEKLISFIFLSAGRGRPWYGKKRFQISGSDLRKNLNDKEFQIFNEWKCPNITENCWILTVFVISRRLSSKF